MMTILRRIHPAFPVFRVEGARRAAIYTPGLLAMVEPSDADAMEGAWRAGHEAKRNQIRIAARSVLQRAQKAMAEARELWSAPFAPECLAVSVGNQCNLMCGYCYAAEIPGRGAPGSAAPKIENGAVLAAARFVAENCARSGREFHLVLQGDGEPSTDWEAVKNLIGSTRDVAASAGTGWFGYISTNGAIHEEKALWLARNCSRVCLSCDGPPGIHDMQRPFPDGSGSSAIVAGTARRIFSETGRLDVRATITPQTMTRQAEIMAYLRDSLGATHMRFEPVYAPRSNASMTFRPEQAAAFADSFLEAQREAQASGVDLSIAGVRLDEIHGPYCDLLRQTLRVNAAGVATACFRGANATDLETGRMAADGRFFLDWDRITALRAAASRIPNACKDCVNVLHCARGCPDYCLAEDVLNGDLPGGSFRCRLHKHLTTAWLRSMLKRSEIDPTLEPPLAAGTSRGLDPRP